MTIINDRLKKKKEEPIIEMKLMKNNRMAYNTILNIHKMTRRVLYCCPSVAGNQPLFKLMYLKKSNKII